MLRNLIVLFLIGTVTFFSVNRVHADMELDGKRKTALLKEGITYLLSQAGKDVHVQFDHDKIASVLDFVTSEKERPSSFDLDERDGATAAYYEIDIGSNLERILNYAYNPDIPPQTFSPSSLRIAYTLPGERRTLPLQWSFQESHERPQIFKIVEHEEITPDLFTGAYYSYEVDRTLMLLRHNASNVFISIARQRDVSEVGKKGAVLGESEAWDYLYSGQKGLTKRGLGWVDSFMYKSFSITVFCQTDTEEPRVRCGIFKWLSAGWAGLNMVKEKHIQKGLDRYGGDFKKIIEFSGLPEPEEMASEYFAMKQLPMQELKKRIGGYLVSLEKKYAGNRILSRKLFSDFLDAGNSLVHLSREQMQAVLMLEYLKSVLGKSSHGLYSGIQ
ncbi:MAG: hypothetical protein KAI75_05775 [Desulfobulbaceae bacterium]|nr:hypothetical protein [Desulfobulbaceae bacterium]